VFCFESEAKTVTELLQNSPLFDPTLPVKPAAEGMEHYERAGVPGAVARCDGQPAGHRHGLAVHAGTGSDLQQ
jgi:hypothetical protein